MVNLIEDWKVLEEYAGEKLGFYQLLKRDATLKFAFKRAESAS